MRINELTFKGFGKWEQSHFHFGPGINLFEAHNESGKTTLLEGMLALLYGLKRDYVRRNMKRDEWDRYRPWGQTVYGGSIAYELGEMRYELHRNLESDDHQLYEGLHLRDITKDFKLDIRKEHPFLFNQLGLTRTLFEELTRIGSLRVDSSKHMMEWLHQIKGSESGATYEEVFNLLEKKRREIGKGAQGRETLMARALMTTQERRQALDEGKRNLAKLSILEAEEHALKADLKNLESQIETWAQKEQQFLQTKQQFETYKVLQEKIERERALLERLLEWEEKVRALEAQREEIKSIDQELSMLRPSMWFDSPEDEQWQNFLDDFREWSRIEDLLTEQGEAVEEEIAGQRAHIAQLTKKIGQLKNRRMVAWGSGILFIVSGLTSFLPMFTEMIPKWVPFTLLGSGLAIGLASFSFQPKEFEKLKRSAEMDVQRKIVSYDEQRTKQMELEEKLAEWFKTFQVYVPKELWFEEITFAARERIRTAGEQNKLTNLKERVSLLKEQAQKQLGEVERLASRIEASWSVVPSIQAVKDVEDRIDAMLVERNGFRETYGHSLEQEMMDLQTKFDLQAEELRQEGEELQRQRNQIEQELARISGEKSIYQHLNVDELLNHYALAQSEVKELERKQRILDRAEQLFQQTLDEWNRDISPLISQDASYFFTRLTGGKYAHVRVDPSDQFMLRVIEAEDQSIRQQSELSTGAQQQLNLAFRLALIKQSSRHYQLPIFFDDSFVHYDDDRLEEALRFMQELAEDHQIFLFTCQGRERQIMDQLGTPYQEIKIEQLSIV